MKILFIHCTLYGQFEFLAYYLKKQGWDVLRKSDNLGYACDYAGSNALGFINMAYNLANEGYSPDIVMAHCGWGVGLCVKDIWPDCKYVAYHEWYYTYRNWDKGGTKEGPLIPMKAVHDRLRNLPIIAEFDGADENWVPTHFQASRFPIGLRDKIRVIHDGVATDTYKPNPEAIMKFNWIDLSQNKHVITYATRGIEPIRGFPQFMRGLRILQTRRSDVHAAVVATDRTYYGSALPENDTWRLRAMDDLNLDMSRIHFYPMLDRPQYLQLLQASSAHIYFTEPFVTSWSLTEALSTGCLVIGSDTAPVQEYITHMENGILADMDDPNDIADMIEWGIDNPEKAQKLRVAARKSIVDNFSDEAIFKEKMALLEMLVKQKN